MARKERTYRVEVVIGCTDELEYKTNDLKEVEKKVEKYKNEPLNYVGVYDYKIHDYIFYKDMLCYEPEINLLGGCQS